MTTKSVDITPTPRILRTLGEIPFQPWQCIAELIDNSIDAFKEAERTGVALNEKKISVCWSGDAVAAQDRALEIIDTGPGMSFDQLQNAARAGYSNNDPIHNLGLFGMGFNIATARLGEKTTLLSAKIDSAEWMGIEIDFGVLIKSRSFNAPVVSKPKSLQAENGTMIVVTKFKDGIYQALRQQEAAIRRQLENIYTPFLRDSDVEIFVQGKRLIPREHCVWSSTRFVIRNQKKFNAVIEIDRDLGEAFFDVDRNRYLSVDEAEEIQSTIDSGQSLPRNITKRKKRLTGWVGIQRYSDPNDFGLDFIRNGRKILIANKSLFSYENPLTGTSTLEYPIELGSTVGGRIVGELNVDYLLPTYQKNDFDRTDLSWADTVEALRSVGPILPQSRKAMGYDNENDSPIGQLVNAYRRTDPGTKCLAIDKSTARTFAERFRKGDVAYRNDDKWWQAALEEDRRNATGGASVAPPVDPGDAPSDDPGTYLGGGTTASGNSRGGTTNTPPSAPTPAPKPAHTPAPTPTPQPTTSKLDDLIRRSTLVTSWTGLYSYGHVPPLNVKVRELTSGKIFIFDEPAPCAFFSEGIDCDFIYDPKHSLLAQFPMTPKELLLIYLAEKFKARDTLTDVVLVFSKLTLQKMQEARIDKTALQERANEMFGTLREKMIEKLRPRAIDVLRCVHESVGDAEETINAMLSNGPLITYFQNCEPAGIAALEHMPLRTLIRIVERFPEELFDGKVFRALYSGLNLGDAKATERSRNESKDRITSFLKDALWVVQNHGGTNQLKNELSRSAISIDFLVEELGT